MKTVQERVVRLDQNGGVGIIINVSKLVPEGQMLQFEARHTDGAPELWVGPLTFYSMQHDFHYPWESKYTRGVRELERDRRRHPRGDA